MSETGCSICWKRCCRQLAARAARPASLRIEVNPRSARKFEFQIRTLPNFRRVCLSTLHLPNFKHWCGRENLGESEFPVFLFLPRTRLKIALNDSDGDSVARQAGGTVDSKLLHEISAMLFDSLDADA